MIVIIIFGQTPFYFPKGKTAFFQLIFKNLWHFSKFSKARKMKNLPHQHALHEIQGNTFESSLNSDSIKDLLSVKSGEGKNETAWLSPLHFSFNNNKLTVYFPHRFFFFWFKEQKQEYFEKYVKEIFGNKTEFVYTWGKNSEEVSFSYLSYIKKLKMISPYKSWDDFFSGERNKDTLSFLQKTLTLSPSFILIKGKSGTGKSLLISIILKNLLLRYDSKSVIKLSGLELHSLLEKEGEINILKTCSALCIDDLHLISENTNTQLILASLMDSLENRSFFIATINDNFSNCFIHELYDRLHSHTVIQLTEPDLDVRMLFTIREMEKADIPENRNIALLISRNCLKLRHIGSVVDSIKNFYKKNNCFPSTDEVLDIMRNNGATQPLDTESILTVVASYFECTSKELTEKTKNQQLSFPRQVAMYLCRELLGESYPSLGLIFGGRDHSTIMYAIKKIGKLKVVNKDVHMVITELTMKLKKGLSEGSSSGKFYLKS